MFIDIAACIDITLFYRLVMAIVCFEMIFLNFKMHYAIVANSHPEIQYLIEIKYPQAIAAHQDARYIEMFATVEKYHCRIYFNLALTERHFE